MKKHIICISALLLALTFLLAYPATLGKYTVQQDGLMEQNYFSGGIYDPSIFYMDHAHDASGVMWGANAEEGSSSSDYTLDTLKDVSLRLVNNSDEPLRIAFKITIKATGGNIWNGSGKNATIFEDTTDTSISLSLTERMTGSGQYTTNSDGSRTFLIDDTVDGLSEAEKQIFVIPPDGIFYSFVLNLSWSNQQQNGYYTMLEIVSLPTT